MLEGAVSWEDTSTFIQMLNRRGTLPVVVNFAGVVVEVDGSRDDKAHWSRVWSAPLQRVQKDPLVVVCWPRMVDAWRSGDSAFHLRDGSAAACCRKDRS